MQVAPFRGLGSRMHSKEKVSQVPTFIALYPDCVYNESSHLTGRPPSFPHKDGAAASHEKPFLPALSCFSSILLQQYKKKATNKGSPRNCDAVWNSITIYKRLKYHNISEESLTPKLFIYIHIFINKLLVEAKHVSN